MQGGRTSELREFLRNVLRRDLGDRLGTHVDVEAEQGFGIGLAPWKRTSTRSTGQSSRPPAAATPTKQHMRGSRQPQILKTRAASVPS